MRKSRATGLVLGVIAGLLSAPGQAKAQEAILNIAAIPGAGRPQKFENGFQIFWRNTSSPGDPNAGETEPDAPVRIFDRSIKELTVCRLGTIIRATDPTAESVSIYDVSARKPGFIAVAAVYARAQGAPIPILMYFDWDGSLLRKITLDALSEIQSLEIDRAGHVWTLNDFDRQNPARSVFTEFDRSGSLVRHFMRPHRRWTTDESELKGGGQTSFGLTRGGVWAWLPESRTPVSTDDEGKAAIQQTELPHIRRSSSVYARRAVFLSDGRLLMDVGWQIEGHHEAGWFIWSSGAGWKKIRSPSRPGNDYLYDMDGDDVIYAAYQSGAEPPTLFRSEPISALLADKS